MQILVEQGDTRKGFLYFFCFYFSLFIFIVRPGEIFPALAGTRLGLISLALTCVAFFATGGPQALRESRLPGLRLMQYFLFLGFLVTCFSSWPRHSFEGWHTILLINTVLYFFWLPPLRSPHLLRRVVTLFVLAGGVLSLSMLFTDFGQVTQQYGRVSVGATYDPNDIAMILAVVFPLNVALFLHGKHVGRLFWGSLLVCLLLGILSTGSRGGLLALGAASLLLLFSTGKRIKIWQKILMILLVAGFVLSPAADTVKERWQAVLSGEDYNVENPEEGGVGRLSLWISGAQLMAENPLTGVGISNTSNAMGTEYGRWRALHNSYLQAGVEMGVLGLVLFVLLLRSVWQNCSKALVHLKDKQDLDFFALVAVCTRISLVSFVVAAFFLSQAYSLIVPVLLLLSNGLYVLAGVEGIGVDVPSEKGNSQTVGGIR